MNISLCNPRGILGFLGALLIAAHMAGARDAAPSYSYEGLLKQMTDLKGLARLPEAGEKCWQASSYDRRSRTPEDAGGWNANSDHGKYLRQEGTEYVMAEAQGPGQVVRIWSANPQGTLKIYLDGATTPQVAAPTKPVTIFSWQNPDRKPVPAGTQPAWIFPAPIMARPDVSSVLCGRRAAGWNLYLPIPYQKSLKVTVDKPDRPGSLYYHVTIQNFPKKTKVPTWSQALLQKHGDLVRKIADQLAQPARGMTLDENIAETISLLPGETITEELYGPAAITQSVLDIQADDLRKALRDVLLTITFDGAGSPQVHCPLGDFFGAMPGKNLYASLPLGITPQGFYSRWYMPFQKNARIELRNEGSQPVTLRAATDVQSIEWEKTLGHFHAKWRRTPKNTTFDWPIINCKGRGRVVGVAMGIHNPISGWWGEGDEKIWIDGEAFPSTFGTGSEDYFGYAWCNTALFIHAYHNQPLCEGPRNGNHSSVNRFHIMDSLPFRKSIRFTMEDWPLGNTIGKDYCATVYWYAAAGQQDDFKPVPVSERQPKEPWKPFTIAGVQEGEGLRIIGKTGGDVVKQGMGQFGEKWSGGQHLWWKATQPGQVLIMAFNAPKNGRYEVLAHLTRSWDYGMFKFTINAGAQQKTLDLFSGKERLCVPSGPLPLGVFNLARGDNLLKIQVAGKHEKSPGYYFGLDGIVLKPMQR